MPGTDIKTTKAENQSNAIATKKATQRKLNHKSDLVIYKFLVLTESSADDPKYKNIPRATKKLIATIEDFFLKKIIDGRFHLKNNDWQILGTPFVLEKNNNTTFPTIEGYLLEIIHLFYFEQKEEDLAMIEQVETNPAVVRRQRNPKNKDVKQSVEINFLLVRMCIYIDKYLQHMPDEFIHTHNIHFLITAGLFLAYHSNNDDCFEDREMLDVFEWIDPKDSKDPKHSKNLQKIKEAKLFMLKILNSQLFINPNDQAVRAFYNEFKINPLPLERPWITNYHDTKYDAYCQKAAPTKPEVFSLACLLPDPAGFSPRDAKTNIPKPALAPDSPILAPLPPKTVSLEKANPKPTLTEGAIAQPATGCQNKPA